MNKKKFLKELEIKLELLKASERKDIIDEYSDHIDLKIKNGKTEIDAVKDFGDIDELVEEILDAYKLNKDYKKPDNNFDKYLTKFLDTVKDVFQNIMDSMNEDTLGFIFKIIISLIAIGFLKIPFYIVERIGSGILGAITFGFIDNILTFVWVLLVQLGYVLTAIFLVFSILKNKEVVKKDKKKKKETKEKKENKKEPKTKLEKRIDEKIKLDKDVKKGIFIVLKIFVVIFCLPFVFALIGLVIGLGVFIKLAIEGVLLIGAICIILGTIFIISDIVRLIFNSMFNPGKIKMSLLVHLIIGFLLIGFGSVTIAFDVMRFDYVDKIPNHNYQFETIEYTYELDDTFDFEYKYGTYTLIEDDTLEDTIKIKVSYIDELIDLKYTVISDNSVKFGIKEKDYYWNEVKDIYNIVIEDLKKNKIYNYIELFLPEYKIYVNSGDINKINTKKN